MPLAEFLALPPGRVALVPLSGGTLALCAVLLASFALAQSTAETKAFESSQYRYSVALPAGCRHDEGPGTLDAVCSTELDPEKSAMASAASALVLEVAAEPVPDDAGKTPADLAQRYDEAQFKAELPEAICGESDKARVVAAIRKAEMSPARRSSSWGWASVAPPCSS